MSPTLCVFIPELDIALTWSKLFFLSYVQTTLLNFLKTYNSLFVEISFTQINFLLILPSANIWNHNFKFKLALEFKSFQIMMVKKIKSLMWPLKYLQRRLDKLPKYTQILARNIIYICIVRWSAIKWISCCLISDARPNMRTSNRIKIYCKVWSRPKPTWIQFI